MNKQKDDGQYVPHIYGDLLYDREVIDLLEKMKINPIIYFDYEKQVTEICIDLENTKRGFVLHFEEGGLMEASYFDRISKQQESKEFDSLKDLEDYINSKL